MSDQLRLDLLNAVREHKLKYPAFREQRFLEWAFSKNHSWQGRIRKMGIAAANRKRQREEAWNRFCESQS